MMERRRLLSFVFSVVAVAMAMSNVATATYRHVCTYEQLNVHGISRGICGPALTSIVLHVCNRTGTNPAPLESYNDKRSLTYPSDFQDSVFSDPDLDKKGMFLDRYGADAFLKSSQMKRDGFRYGRASLVCECCINRCSVAEMRTYCRRG